MTARSARRFAACVAVGFALAGCNSSSGAVVKLDGSPRVPDVEGVVKAASIDGITLDGNR